jgi:hypothetical protein
MADAGDTSLETSLCAVERRCSSTGRLCGVDDRGCQDEAIASGLEVICERPDPRAYVYCPPGARDSGAMWILLGFAMAVAIVGSIVAWVLLRKRLGEG